ncbi:SGNH/GDSL hydrolase family protein [uncultured Amnibacterium sp.]|uniref:SGNH/GDSL hydrolase family protein n=1 Tax=uncultured Amnibacterium sp. TaxID=1631851 RepID=UPI0035CA04D0
MREWLTRERAGAPYWLLLLVSIAVVTGLALTVPSLLRSAPKGSTALPAYTPTPAPSDVPFTKPEDPRMLVLGDSYTQGFAADPATSGYAYLIGKQLGWRTEIKGVGSTGYTYGGVGGQKLDYGTRIQQYIDSSTFDPNVIVLEGSQNDYRAVPTVTAAVVKDVRLLRTAYPLARIVLFGPAAPQPLQNNLSPIDAALQAAANQLDVPYISPYQDKWFTVANTKQYGYSDGAHLNTAGHAYLAKRFLEDFEPLFGS